MVIFIDFPVRKLLVKQSYPRVSPSGNPPGHRSLRYRKTSSHNSDVASGPDQVAQWRLGPNGMVFFPMEQIIKHVGSAGLKRKKNGFSIVWPWEIRFWHIWFSTLNWTLSFVYEYIWYPPLAVIIWARKSRRVTIVNQESRFRLGGIFGT